MSLHLRLPKLYRAVMPSDELDLCQRNRNFDAIATLHQSLYYDQLRLDSNTLASPKPGFLSTIHIARSCYHNDLTCTRFSQSRILSHTMPLRQLDTQTSQIQHQSSTHQSAATIQTVRIALWCKSILLSFVH